MTKVERLVARLQDLDLAVRVEAEWFARTRAGHWQRSSGAWSWSIGQVGSQYAVGKLLRCDDWQVYTHHFDLDVTISPCETCMTLIHG